MRKLQADCKEEGITEIKDVDLLSDSDEGSP
jgi:hypothetical protein